MPTCGTLTVVKPEASLSSSCSSVFPNTLNPGESVTIKGEVTNTGDADGQADYEFLFDGKRIGTTGSVTVAAGETEQVDKIISYDEIQGTVGSGTGTVSLELISTSTQSGQTAGVQSLPGGLPEPSGLKSTGTLATLGAGAAGIGAMTLLQR